jgi:hypothetical protein
MASCSKNLFKQFLQSYDLIAQVGVHYFFRDLTYLA